MLRPARSLTNRKVVRSVKRILVSVALTGAMIGVIAGPAAASTAALTAIYNSTVKPLPPNLPSVGAEAYSFNEFGDAITFAPSTPRKLKQVTVTLSSWGCETGHW